MSSNPLHFGVNRSLHFLALFDRTIEIAKERIKLRDQGVPDDTPPGALEILVEALYKDRERAKNGQLEPSRGVVTLGVLREVADWASETSESPLLRAAQDLESSILMR